jgi:hypothetical protein
MERKQPYLVQFTVGHKLPISISSCERSFSSAKFALNPLRACMKSDLFEALETLRAWCLQKLQDDDRSEKDIRWKELEVISQALEGYGMDSDAELLEFKQNSGKPLRTKPDQASAWLDLLGALRRPLPARKDTKAARRNDSIFMKLDYLC